MAGDFGLCFLFPHACLAHRLIALPCASPTEPLSSCDVLLLRLQSVPRPIEQRQALPDRTTGARAVVS
eukprot:2755167-Pyramimonas_sp.AAC.1